MLGIDACPMEGFDAAALDLELGLAEQGLQSVVLLALGYSSAEDFNAKLPKSRLAADEVMTRL
jgi:nitroreductase/dihydropteridine reductase